MLTLIRMLSRTLSCDAELSVTAAMVGIAVRATGVGLDPAKGGSGLGLRGIDERVKELHGTMAISQPSGRGTRVAVSLPVPLVNTEAALASAAG